MGDPILTPIFILDKIVLLPKEVICHVERVNRGVLHLVMTLLRTEYLSDGD